MDGGGAAPARTQLRNAGRHEHGDGHDRAAEVRLDVDSLELDRPIAFDPYVVNRDMGGFVVIDRITNQTLGAGMLNFELRRSQNVRPQPISVGKAAHARQKGQRPCSVWLTGAGGRRSAPASGGIGQNVATSGRSGIVALAALQRA